MKAKFIILLITLDLVALFIGLNFGSSGVDLFDGLRDTTAKTIIVDVRMPRALVAMAVGMALAASGTIMQALFRNPLADPYILGVSSGASVGAALVIVAGIASAVNITTAAFLASLLTAFAVYRLGKTRAGLPVLTLLLAGVAMAYFLSGVTSFLIYIAAKDMHQVVFWVMGGFWTANWFKLKVITLPIILGVTFGLYNSWKLNAVLLGEEHALSVGLNVEVFKKRMIVVSALLTSAAVAVSGVIGFVGLIVPHAMRLLIGEDNRILLPSAILCGAAFMTLVDVIARLITEGEIPVGIITALIGSPFFIFLLRRGKYAA
jgi:iron complex transport system permease protein